MRVAAGNGAGGNSGSGGAVVGEGGGEAGGAGRDRRRLCTAARASGYVLDNTFVTGDATAVWIVTPGPRFFRKLTAGATAP